MDCRLIAALLLASNTARADDNHSRDKVLLADGICDAVALSAAIPKLPEDVVTLLFWGGIVGQALTAPALHAADEDYGRAGISLGVRIGAPIIGGIVGGALCEKLSEPGTGELRALHCLGGAVLGGLVGIVAAQVTDWLVISKPTTVEMKPVGGVVFRF